MGWRENLRPASFRGVGFHMDDRSASTGRRIALHEYPKRDAPFPEDMGKATRRWSVEAYIVGDDYMSRRDALYAACESAGPARYVDFWRGESEVVCESCDLKETDHDGRMCRFTLSFIEAGAAGFGGVLMPFASAATASQLVTAASSLVSVARSTFESIYRR